MGLKRKSPISEGKACRVMDQPRNFQHYTPSPRTDSSADRENDGVGAKVSNPLPGQNAVDESTALVIKM